MKPKDLIPTVASAGLGKKFNVLGHAITTLLTKQSSGGTYYVFECITPPGLGIPPHVHSQEDELIYISEGEFSIMLGNKRFHAQKGDLCFFPKNIPHAFQNIGARAGITEWTVIPGENFEDFFEELGALPAGEPDLQKVAEIFENYGMKILMPEPA
jgi:quercetin dioxygenase-like cupin family protein